MPLAGVEHVLAAAVGERVAVLDGDDVDDAARLLELADLDVAQADVADLALVLELLERADDSASGTFGSTAWSW